MAKDSLFLELSVSDARACRQSGDQLTVWYQISAALRWQLVLFFDFIHLCNLLLLFGEGTFIYSRRWVRYLITAMLRDLNIPWSCGNPISLMLLLVSLHSHGEGIGCEKVWARMKVTPTVLTTYCIWVFFKNLGQPISRWSWKDTIGCHDQLTLSDIRIYWATWLMWWVMKGFRSCRLRFQTNYCSRYFH